MTPSDYGNGGSLMHDRMQADFLEWIVANGPRTRTITHGQQQLDLVRHGPWAEVPLQTKGVLRGFVDILERWSPPAPEDTKIRPVQFVHYVAYEIKPRLTTIGGLIRQMRAEEVLIEQWGRTTDMYSVKVSTVPIVNHDDPELPLLRRLWPGAVGVWNAEERNLT